METKITRDNICKHLIEYQLSMVDKTLIDTLDNQQWYFDFTFTTEQYEEFKKYSLALIKKTFKCSSFKTNQTFDWFNLQFGLRIKNSVRTCKYCHQETGHKMSCPSIKQQINL